MLSIMRGSSGKQTDACFNGWPQGFKPHDSQVKPLLSSVHRAGTLKTSVRTWVEARDPTALYRLLCCSKVVE